MPLICKDDVRFAVIAPGGFRLLAALDRVSRVLGIDLMITSATDGQHSGPTDPHYRGEAYDVRTHPLTPEQKTGLVHGVLAEVSVGVDDAPVPTSGGWATRFFFGFLESAGQPNEHAHFQVRKGVTFPIFGRDT